MACFRITEAESERLNAFAEAQGRTQTDVIREYIRSLEADLSEPLPKKKTPRKKHK